MMDRDMRPTRFDLTLQYAREFVTEWFDQNPLGQIGVVGMRAGIGERIGEMSGQQRQFDHLSSLKTERNIQAIRRIYLGP
jgi:transcription initiation factor TFIIH subunit 2